MAVVAGPSEVWGAAAPSSGATDVACGRAPAGSPPETGRLSANDITELAARLRSGLGRDATAGEVVHAAVAVSVARLVHHEPLIRRRGDDPEDVHQARVATRRLRSDLRTFAPLLDQPSVEPLRDELRWLAARLGAVRDADVLGQRLRYRLDDLPGPGDRAAAAPVLAVLAPERDQARDELCAALCSERHAVLLGGLAAAATAIRIDDGADGPARKVLPLLVRAPWRRVKRAVRVLDDETDRDAGDRLHEVRKRAKRCRYAAEAVAPVVGKPARRFAEAMEQVQEVLGERQDATVSGAWLQSHVPDDVAGAFAVGQLVAMEERAAADATAAWRATWKRARQPELRFWR